MALEEQAVTLDAGGVTLEAMLHAPDAAHFAAVVLHPHPRYGGDMHNHVVTTACGALATLGAATLRLNFRGTGGSGGTHDDGRAEQDDARAGIARVREAAPGRPLLLAGYSFGAQVAASVAARRAPDALALISPPVAYAPLPKLPEGLPLLVITGGQDPVAPADIVRGLDGHGIDVVVVPGVDHGWWGGDEALAAALIRLAGRLPGVPPAL